MRACVSVRACVCERVLCDDLSEVGVEHCPIHHLVLCSKQSQFRYFCGVQEPLECHSVHKVQCVNKVIHVRMNTYFYVTATHTYTKTR
jgi:hypothetical protein